MDEALNLPQRFEIDALIRQHAQDLSARLHEHRASIFPPHARKSLRRFTSGEAAKLIGVKDGYLRTLSLDGRGPQPETGLGGRRYYSAQDLLELRELLERTARADRRYLPGRRQGDHLQLIATVNFKGGSGKTTVSTYMAQWLALQGYRVLAIDLDPQASLTAMFGVQPEIDLKDNETLYGAIRYEGARPIREVIQSTYFPGIDLIPGDLELMEFEHETPRALQKRDEEFFFARLGQAIAPVEADYDVVIFDCPPQLGYLTLSALCAATGVLITVHPAMLDILSMTQFLLMTSDLLAVVKQAGGNLDYDWLRYLVTRYEPSDGPQTQMLAFMRSMFEEYVMTNAFLKSTAVSDAGITKQTLLEVDRSQFTRATYDRAMESVEAVGSELHSLIQAAWGR